MTSQENSFGMVLKKMRNEMELTQQQLAESLGISTSYLKDLESCKRSPSHDMFNRIMSYLNLSADVVIHSKKKQGGEDYIKMTNILNRCNEKQRKIILALAETILDMSELNE